MGYVLKEDSLFKLGVCALLLKCITQEQGIELMKEIHGGMCGSHITARALAGKALRQGFYWLMAIRDAEQIVKTCKACQFASNHQRRPGALSHLISPTWPLQHWGMDIVWPLPTAQGNFKFVVVAVEYFTKWIEARPVATITSANIRKFFCQQIICRFGVPKELTVDNGKQFDCQDFREYCRSIGMKLRFASIYHPQSNEAVERANGQIFSAIKKHLFKQQRENGPMSYQDSFGLTTPLSQELPSSPCSGCFTEPKPCARKSWTTKAPEFWWAALAKVKR
jgi:hypothetical protein